MKEYGDYPEIHDYTTIGEGDHIVAIRNGYTTTIAGTVGKAATDCSGPTMVGMTYSLEPSGWTFRMIRKAWHAPTDAGWYVSAEAVRIHGVGSSLHVYRLSPAGEWYRTASAGAAGGWIKIRATSLPQDIRKLDFSDE